ncbi:MAG: hypothetical protein O7F08_04225 [Deltaproteobacteria bacterium]|nr:hypothetical protein [Deltaproteobacteria bacterium]
MNPPPSGKGFLDNVINIDETGEMPACEGTNPPDDCFTWTNTTVEGRVHLNNGCLGLTTNDSSFASSNVGKVTSVAGGWTQGGSFTCATDTPRIYCFEQSTADPIPDGDMLATEKPSSLR